MGDMVEKYRTRFRQLTRHRLFSGEGNHEP